MTYSSHYLPSLQQGYRVFLLSVLLMGLCAPAHSADLPAFVVDTAHEYFPDQVGNEWVYRGRMIEGGLVQIAEKDTQFANVSKVMGKETIDGVEVVVFHDTNPGNQGPSDSYYRRDAAGIRYYGSKPGTTLERQLVPYQIVQFPLEVPSSFEQFNRHGLELGMDIDRDGEAEKVDIVAISSVQGQETVSVPSGTYPKAIRLEAKMTMQVHLSESGKTIQGTDTMTVWFARGVGLLKYIERQTIPSSRSENERVVEVTEELEKVTLATDVASLYRGTSIQEYFFDNNLRFHEWLQVAMSSRLSPDF
jgi:hypothetical protein